MYKKDWMKKRVSRIDLNRNNDEIHHYVFGVNISDYSFEYHEVAVKEKVENDPLLCSLLSIQRWPNSEMCYDGWNDFYSHFDYKTCVSSFNNITFIDAEGHECLLRIGDWIVLECKYVKAHPTRSDCWKFIYEIEDRYGKKEAFEFHKRVHFKKSAARPLLILR
jgi:hypothetical protein